jgi:hypothetical protein
MNKLFPTKYNKPYNEIVSMSIEEFREYNKTINELSLISEEELREYVKKENETSEEEFPMLDTVAMLRES